MARRRYISSEISIDQKLNKVSDFAAVLYTWGIPHAKDDCRISAENAEELRSRIVPGRSKTVEQVQMALDELKLAGLVGVDEKGELYYPANSFYKYQTYVNAGSRRETPENTVSVSSSVSSSLKEETRKSASPGLLKRRLKAEENGKGESPMASMNLIPELKAAADAIYYTDPAKFRTLAKWIGQGRKNGWSEEAMAKTLREFKAGSWDLVDEWYPYLDAMLKRIDKDLNRDESDAEARRHKEEIRDLSKDFFKK